MLRPLQRVADGRFVRDERGTFTVFGLYIILGILMFAGLALDTANVTSARTQLQITADGAGFAALYARRQGKSEAEAKTIALNYAAQAMPPSRFGSVLVDGDIEFGTWNHNTRTFTVASGQIEAVRVNTRRLAENDNSVTTFLLKLVGVPSFDLTTTAIWDAGKHGCTGEGFFANGKVDMTSGNTYRDGFCVHSNSYVEFQQGNTFEDGVIVSMPDENDLVVPASGLREDKNPGLASAVRSYEHDLSHIFDGITTMANDFSNPSYAGQPAYINALAHPTAVPVSVGNGQKLKASDLTKYAVNEVSCTGNTLTIDKNQIIEQVVLVTDCAITFNQGSSIEDAIVVTKNTGKKSISAPKGFRLGADDHCAPGGGASIVTLGDFSVAAGMEVFGGEIVADGDVSFTANANGIQGLNFLANGDITGTANGEMAFCGEDGIDGVIDITRYRMVM